MNRQRAKAMQVYLDAATFREWGLDRKERCDRARAGFFLGLGTMTIARILADFDVIGHEADDVLETALALGMNDEDEILIRRY